ncbi:MAG: hypothetical protein KF824_03725 [Fimbriimonadaceae bacterium]|nr:MAG: hypothetical protein KF824_03725 [Fimbriimonadaceae bacterium]
MDKTVVGLVFGIICFVLRQSFVLILGKMDGIVIPLYKLFNTWSLTVVCVTALLTFFITFMTFRAKHPVIVGIVAAVVGTLVFLPGLLPDLVSSDLVALQIVFVDWLVTGTLAAYPCFYLLGYFEKKRAAKPNRLRSI